MDESYLQSSPIRHCKHDGSDNLNHSGESFTSYSDDFTSLLENKNERDNYLPVPPPLTSTYNSGRPLEDDSSVIVCCADDDHELTMWELWLVKKLELERKKFKKKKAEAKKQKVEEERKQKEREERMKAAEERHKEWVQEKLLKLKLEKAAERRENKIKAELEQEKQAKLRADAEANFKKWKHKNREKEHSKALKEKEQRDENLRLQEEKKKLCEKKYKEWLENSKERWLATRKSGPPSPSYINHRPWVGPNEDETRRKPSTPPMMPPTEKLRQMSYSSKRSSTPLVVPCHRKQVDTPETLIRTNNRLRFAGIRPKSSRATSISAQPRQIRSSTPKTKVRIPRPFNGIEDTCKYSTSFRNT